MKWLYILLIWEFHIILKVLHETYMESAACMMKWEMECVQADGAYKVSSSENALRIWWDMDFSEMQFVRIEIWECVENMRVRR